MQASEKSLSQILTESNIYEIPSYQRPYSWEVDNVEQLLNDIWEAYEKNKEDEYFVGSLITIEIEKNKKYEVVDGQQRLTTFNLIFAGFVKKVQDDTDAKADYKRRILPRNGTPRLLLRKNDQNFFQEYILNSNSFSEDDYAKLKSPQRNLIENLKAINRWIDGKDEKAVIQFAEYMLHKVYCVLVVAESQKSAYRLFNVLNARGMSLSNADLIKNALFNELKDIEKEGDILEEKWLELEDEVGINELDSFFGQYRTNIKADKASDSLFVEFNPIIKANHSNPIKFLDQLHEAAEIYTKIKTAKFDKSYRLICSLNRVSFDEWIAPLLTFMINKSNQNLAEFEQEFIASLEKITYQNWVRRLGRAARLTVYNQIIKAIHEKKSFNDIRQIFKDNSNNDEFYQFLDGEVYGKPFAHAVLVRLDEAIDDESITRTYTGKLSIEHVLPQSLKDEYWKSRFDDGAHKYYLNKIGNLAMLSGSKNSKAQNYDFEKKKNIYSDKQSTVSFDLTKKILNCSEWDSKTIDARQAELLTLAKSLWAIH